jgi:hypothetical protein
LVKAIVKHSLISLAKEEIANSKANSKTIILEANKNRINLLRIAMVLQVKSNKKRIRKDRIKEEKKDRIREDKIKEDRIKVALVKEKD